MNVFVFAVVVVVVVMSDVNYDKRDNVLVTFLYLSL